MGLLVPPPKDKTIYIRENRIKGEPIGSRGAVRILIFWRWRLPRDRTRLYRHYHNLSQPSSRFLPTPYETSLEDLVWEYAPCYDPRIQPLTPWSGDHYPRAPCALSSEKCSSLRVGTLVSQNNIMGNIKVSLAESFRTLGSAVRAGVAVLQDRL